MSEIKDYYQEYGKKVYLYLLSLSRDADTAEELMQETFCEALRCLNRYDGSCSVYSWLCSIAKHLWLRELDRRKRHPIAEPDETIPDPNAAPDKMAELKEQKLSLMRQIHALPEQEKELILLRATGALSFREIGELFGKTENWARVTYYRTKQKLSKE
ncbi:MAG: sigma-70 family RNA polymerase sigma factor [Ruminococcus sp.]|nr:sigma-70 family RNA polymerase sigma factor [Ruminococcus sp.]